MLREAYEELLESRNIRKQETTTEEVIEINKLPLSEKLFILLKKGFSIQDASLSLCLNNGDIEKTFGSLALTLPIRKRFILKCNCCFEGIYQNDGIYNNAARYRHGESNKMWILFYEGKWCFSDHSEAQGRRVVFLENSNLGREVNGILEIPSNGWEGDDKEFGPYEFCWVD